MWLTSVLPIFCGPNLVLWPPIPARKALCPKGKGDTGHNHGGAFTILFLALRLPLNTCATQGGGAELFLESFLSPQGQPLPLGSLGGIL